MMLFFFFFCYHFEVNGVDMKHNEGNYGKKKKVILEPLVLFSSHDSHTVTHCHAPSTAADGFSFWGNVKL